MINPSSALKTNALEAGGELDAGLSKEKDETVAEEAVDNGVADASITPRDITAPSVTFEIDGAGQNEVVETSVDEVAYRSHIVKVSLNNVDEYFLFISGDANLKAPNGGVELTGVGSNVIGSSITAGQWGYGWDYTGSTANASMKYNTMPTVQTKLTVPPLSNNAVSFNGKLNFAAKFPTNATLGNYTSNVNLTLIASPKAQTGSVNWRNETGGETALAAGTETMQGIKAGFCKNNTDVKEGWAVDLVDNRDNKTYTIYKAADGNCWMGQNLALTGPLTLASGDTDLVDGATWSLPASVGSNGKNENDINTSNSWDTSNNNVIQIRTGSTELSTGWLVGYGNYYSWSAATAGTGTTSLTNTDASASICPKGWKLPSSSQFSTLVATKSGWTTVKYNGNSSTSGYYIGYIKTNLYKSANLWTAAGNVDDSRGALTSTGSRGVYWSRGAYSINTAAYYLELDSGGIRIAIKDRRNGYSVRCVANY